MLHSTLVLVLAAVAQAGSPLRVDSVVPLAGQPQATDPSVIWYDDFDGPEKPYTESSGAVLLAEGIEDARHLAAARLE